MSVIIPAFNEEERLPDTVREVENFLSRQDYNYEVIIVNDGSTDNTADVVATLTTEYPGLMFIDYKVNMGKGYAVKQGMLAASGRIRLFMDADNSTTIDQFELMVPFFNNGYDVVIGSRAVEGAVINIHQSRFRETLGKAFNYFARICSGISIKDTQAGFKAFTSESAKNIFTLQSINKWSFDLELLVLSNKFGYRIKEVPITWNNDFRSHVKLIHVFNTILELLKIRYNLWTGFYSENGQ